MVFARALQLHPVWKTLLCRSTFLWSPLWWVRQTFLSWQLCSTSWGRHAPVQTSWELALSLHTTLWTRYLSLWCPQLPSCWVPPSQVSWGKLGYCVQHILRRAVHSNEIFTGCVFSKPTFITALCTFWILFTRPISSATDRLSRSSSLLSDNKHSERVPVVFEFSVCCKLADTDQMAAWAIQYSLFSGLSILNVQS